MDSRPDASLYSVRPCTAEDIAVVAQIESQVQQAPWTAEQFAVELTKPYSHFLVVTDDETDTQIAAYCVFWVLDRQVEILTIAVDLRYRGLGFAQRLIAKAVDIGLQLEANHMILDVRKSNESAIFLYQSRGFTIHKVKKNHYSNGEDAYEMLLDLTGSAGAF